MTIKQSHCTLDITSDNIWAYLKITAPFTEEDSIKEEVHRLLRDKGITFGIIEEQLDYLHSENTHDDILIAKGMYPIDGDNAVIEYFFDVKHHIAPHTNADGSINLKELGFVDKVKKDALLVKKTPATKGNEGITLTSTPIPANDGLDIPLVCGTNCYITDDGLEIHADIDGALIFDKGTVNVVNIIEIDEDIGVGTGNIDFNGEVVVHGDIKDGMFVSCKRLIVDGVIEGASVETTENILVAKGIAGHEQAVIKAGGNVICKYISNATVTAQGNVETGAILNANVRANRTIHVEGKKGCIIGGSVFARNEVISPVLGSELGIATQVLLGLRSDLKNKIQLENITLNHLLQIYEKTEQCLILLDEKLALAPYNKKYSDLKAKYTNNHHEVKKQITEHKLILDSLTKQLKISGPAKIKIDKVYPDVHMDIDGNRIDIMEQQSDFTMTVQ